MSRSRYFAVRTVQTVFLLWLILTFLFLFFRLMPGSFASRMTVAGASPEAVAAFRQKWGLNDPLYVQYYRYMVNFLAGDVGTSLRFRIPVWNYVRLKIFNSLILVAPALTVAYILGSLSGTVMGYFRGSKLERYGMVPIIFFGSFPAFYLAILMIIIFSGWLGIFPTSGMFSSTFLTNYQGPWWQRYLTTEFLWHYILPFSTIVLRYLFIPSTIMRTSVIETMGQDFTYYHRVTGLSLAQKMKHIGKHSILPVITVYPASMTRALGGMVLVETVFNWPGIGYALVQAVLARDFPTIQFVFFLVAAFIIISNFVVDIIYGFIDPRVTVGE